MQILHVWLAMLVKGYTRGRHEKLQNTHVRCVFHAE